MQLREAGYVPGTETDTDQIPPAIAAHAIAAYTRPGDLVLDPDCGAGTVLIEALRAGRHTIGLTARTRWWRTARVNITAAKAAGAWPDGSVLDAHPKALATVRGVGLLGRVGLVLTALRTDTEAVGPEHDLDTSFRALARTLRHCRPLLRLGGRLVVVARPRRHLDGSLVDLATPLLTAGAAAGLVPVEHCVALTAELRGSRLITRASLAQRHAAARFVGTPVVLTAHHEVLVFELLCAADIDRPTVRYLGSRRAA